VSIIITHAALVLMLDIFLIIREVVSFEPVFEVCPEPFYYSDVLNPRLLR